MAANKRPKDYLHNSNLLREIVKSQSIQQSLPEEEREERVAECLTPELVDMLTTLVDRFGTHYRWRGYTWIEDMKAEAMLNLCKVALKFNLEKAGDNPNPFGYYTQVIKRVFLTFIEREKKQGKIKDEIIEMSDSELLPSFGRQNEDDGNSLGIDLDGTKEIESDPRRRKRIKRVPKRNLHKPDDTSQMTEGEYKAWLKKKVEEFQNRTR